MSWVLSGEARGAPSGGLNEWREGEGGYEGVWGYVGVIPLE